MTSKTLAAIALVLLIGALPAGAAHRAPEPRDPKLVRLAHELESATQALYASAAERRARGAASRYALHALRQLEREAYEFRAAVERNGGFGRASRRELREVERALASAEARISELRPSRSTRRELQRVAGLLDRAADRFAARDDRDGPHRDPRGAERHAEVRWPFGR